MFTDYIPLPSKGIFYENSDEYIEVAYLTTEDELMLTSTNLFHKGDALYKLLEKKICDKNIKINDLLVFDKEFILLWLRESAYGNIIKSDNTKDTFYLDTNNIKINSIKILPDDGLLYTHIIDNDIYKFKLLTVYDEKKLKDNDKLSDYHIAHIFSINGNEDKEFIKQFIKTRPILEGRKITKYINSISFGLDRNVNFIYNDEHVKEKINIDEVFFGYSKENLSKINKTINMSMFFLQNEGNGYTRQDILTMATHHRIFNEEKLSEKIKDMNDKIKNNK